METIIYTKTQPNNMMKKINYIFMILILLLVPAYSQNQEYIFNYEFEEGSGNIILDNSGNDNHLVSNGITWTTDEVNDNYAIDLDGNLDYAQSPLNITDKGKISLSLWAKPNSNSKDTLFVIYDDFNLSLIHI